MTGLREESENPGCESQGEFFFFFFFKGFEPLLLNCLTDRNGLARDGWLRSGGRLIEDSVGGPTTHRDRVSLFSGVSLLFLPVASLPMAGVVWGGAFESFCPPP